MMLTTTMVAPCSRSSQRSAMAVSEAFLQLRDTAESPAKAF